LPDRLTDVLVDTAREERWLREGFYLGYQLAEGFAFFRIITREHTNLSPYSLGTVAADGVLAKWDEIREPVEPRRRYLEPEAQRIILHGFYGVYPPPMRIYLRHPARVDRWSLVGVRELKGDVGYIDGYISPFHAPSIKSEFFSLVDLYPQFQAYNPTDVSEEALLNFQLMKYTYEPVRDKELIKAFIERKIPAKFYSPGSDPPAAPEWLVKLFTRELLEYSKGLLEMVK